MAFNSGINEPTTNSSGWDVPLNNNFIIVDSFFSTVTTVNITAATTTLTSPSSTPNTSPAIGQTQTPVINLTGNLTTVGSNATVQFPAGIPGRWTVKNNTTGSYTVTLKIVGVSANTIVVPQTYALTIYSDGSTGLFLDNDGLSQSGGSATFGALTASSATITNGLTAATFTGKVVTRVNSITSSATPAPNADTTDQFEITAQAVTITSFGAPTGTPTDGQKLIIRIYSAGAQTITAWNAIYAPIGTSLPTTTVAGKYIYVGCVYNSQSSKWDVIATATQA